MKKTSFKHLKIRKGMVEVKKLIIGILLIVCLGVAYYFHFIINTEILYTHFFYIPIVLACIWWGWKGVPVGVILTVGIVLIHITSEMKSSVADDLIRGVMFIIVGCVIAVAVERRMALNKSLLESEEKYRELINGMSDTAWVIDFNANFIYVNNTAVEVLGYSREELLSMGPQDIDTSLDVEEIKGLIEQIPTDEIQIFETTHTTKDGKTIPVEVKSSIVTYQGKQVILSIARDITERKQAEKELRTNEAQLANAMQIARLGSWEYDVDSNLFTFNDHFYAIFRTTADKVGGYTMSPARYTELFLHPDDKVVVGIEMKKALETTDPHFSRRLEHRIIYADGNTGWISVSFFIVKDARGHTVKTYGVNQDITERKKLEEIWRKYEFIANTSGDFMTLINLDYEYEVVNEAYCLAHRRKREEIIGKTVADVWGGEKFKTIIKNRLDRCFKGIVVKDSDCFEFPALGLRNFEITYYPYRDKSGIITHAVVITHDITERKKMEEEKDKLQKQMVDAAKYAALGEMAGGTAHEINNPLTGILATSEFLKNELPKGSQPAEDAKEIFENAKRIRDTVKNFLGFSRKRDYSFSRKSIKEVVESSLKLVGEHRFKKYKILRNFERNLPGVFISEVHIQEVFVNITNNAFDSMDKEGALTITAKKEDNFEVVSFKDTGCGISKEDLKRIFEPFFTTKEKLKGTGLGMSAAAVIMSKHGGRIEGLSEGKGNGAEFRVYFPSAETFKKLRGGA